MNMKIDSILLGLDGTEESKHAAQLSWSLAKAMKCKVVAQTVVDTDALRQLLTLERPGFIGSSPYVNAYEAAHSALKSVAELLLVSYESHVASQGVDWACHIDEGNVAAEIARRAIDHDLVVIGRRAHNRLLSAVDRNDSPRRGLVERLLYCCPRPILVVHDRCQLWKESKFVMTPSGFDASSLRFYLKFAMLLGMQREIYCMAAENSVSDTVLKVRELIPKQEHLNVTGHQCSQLHSAWQRALDVSAETLAVVPVTWDNNGTRLCYGTEAGAFARALNLPATLYLPVSAAEPSEESSSTSKYYSAAKT